MRNYAQMYSILRRCNQPNSRPIEHRLTFEQMSPKLGKYSSGAISGDNSSAISVYIGFA